MKVFSKVLAGILAVAMMLSLASCGDSSWVYKYEDETISSGVYLAMLLDGYYIVSDYDEFSEINEADEFIKSTTADGTPVKDEIVKVTKDSIAQNIYAKSELAKAGIEVSEEEISSMKQTTDQMYDAYYIGLYDVNGVGKDSYFAYYLNMYYYDLYFQYLYGDKYENGGSLAPADDEFFEYYKDNYVSFYAFSATMSTELVESESVTEEQAAANMESNLALEKIFTDYETRIKNGESFEAIRQEEAKRTDVELEKDTDGDIKPMEATVSSLDKLESTSADVAAALKDMKVGEVKAINAGGVMYLVVKNEMTVSKDDEAFKNEKNNILYDLKSDEYKELLSQNTGSIELKANDYAVKLYSPTKLVINNY